MKAADFYDSIADDYESAINTKEVGAQFMSELADIFSDYNISEGSILDVGCGPGNLKSTLGSTFTYTGIDISQNMLALAREKGYSTSQGPIEEILPKISSKSFDYVVAISSLYFVKELDTTLEQFDRIARKGWIISLDDIPQNYIDNAPFSSPLYNHIDAKIKNTSKDIRFHAWTSPITGDEVNARMIFKKL